MRHKSNTRVILADFYNQSNRNSLQDRPMLLQSSLTAISQAMDSLRLRSLDRHQGPRLHLALQWGLIHEQDW